MLSDVLKQNSQLVISRVSQLSRLSGQAMEQKLLPIGVSLQEFRIIGLLLGEDKTTQKQLAEKLSVRQATLSIAISKLEVRGIVERLPSDSDGRVNYLRLTKRCDITEMSEILNTVEQQMTKGISATELQTTRKVMALLINNLLQLNK